MALTFHEYLGRLLKLTQWYRDTPITKYIKQGTDPEIHSNEQKGWEKRIFELEEYALALYFAYLQRHMPTHSDGVGRATLGSLHRRPVSKSRGHGTIYMTELTEDEEQNTEGESDAGLSHVDSETHQHDEQELETIVGIGSSQDHARARDFKDDQAIAEYLHEKVAEIAENIAKKWLTGKGSRVAYLLKYLCHQHDPSSSGFIRRPAHKEIPLALVTTTVHPAEAMLLVNVTITGKVIALLKESHEKCSDSYAKGVLTQLTGSIHANFYRPQKNLFKRLQHLKNKEHDGRVPHFVDDETTNNALADASRDLQNLRRELIQYLRSETNYGGHYFFSAKSPVTCALLPVLKYLDEVDPAKHFDRGIVEYSAEAKVLRRM